MLLQSSEESQLPTWIRIAGGCTLLLLITVSPAWSQGAGNSVQSAQEALKREQFFFGEPSGSMDNETRAALRRFQIHRGLPVTGDMDSATLQVLQQPSTIPGVPGSEVPVGKTASELTGSVRERSREAVRSDQDFLADIEEAGALPPPAPRVQPELQVKPPPAPVERRSTQPPPPPNTAPAQRPESGEPVISPEEAREFVTSYLQAAEGETPAREIAHYASRVDYFDSGRVGREFIEKDQRNYYRRWPERDFDLLGDPELLRNAGSEAVIRFRIRYAVGSGKESAKGQTENVIRVKRDGEYFAITGIKERKLAR